MAKIRIEFQITVLVIIIASAVIATGYMAYKSLSGIITTVRQEANPNYQLFLIKDITADLASLENVVRLYVLTGNDEDLAPYRELNEKVAEKLDTLIGNSSTEYPLLAHDFYKLAVEKLEIWQEVLSLHQTSRDMDPVFTQIYSRLEYTDVDTVITETRERGILGGLFGKDVRVDTLSDEAGENRLDPDRDTTVNREQQKGFLRGLFGGKRAQEDSIAEVDGMDTLSSGEKKPGFLDGIFGGKTSVKTDTVLVEKKLQSNDISKEIHHLESLIREKDAQISNLESKLIQRNGEIGDKLNQLIAQREQFEAESRLEKTADADLLARVTYKRMAAFSIAAVLLLLVVIYMLFNYQKKSRAYQRALKNAKLEAEKLAAAKEQFAANISHEMRTPVNAVYSLSEQLYRQSGNSPFKDQLAILARSAGHLRSVINDTLDFSKIQAQKLKFDAVHFSPASVFEEVISIQNIEAREKGIDLVYRSLGYIPQAVVGDPLRLRQILFNLVSNAVKFTEKGQIVIEVKPGNETKDKILLEFRIADTGIGISAHDLEVIFDEFVQAGDERGKKYRGTGLGLSIVKKLVEMQDGNISVESKLHKGTSVSVSIPYMKGDPEKIEPEEQVRPDIPVWFRASKVLIADDEEFNRLVIKNLLDKWGLSHEEAPDGVEAVVKARKSAFDVILLDMRMPGKSGIEAAREILKADPDARIVAVTASDRQADREACMQTGMKGFLLKPFSENELFSAIYPLLKYKKAESANGKHFTISTDVLNELGNGDPSFLNEMIRLFIHTTEEGLTQLDKAVTRRDWSSVSEVAHKMAAPSRYIHADDLYEKLKELEYARDNQGNVDMIPELFAGLKEVATEVLSSLRDFLQERKI
jgi:signal transduction histidine kinase/CheY-like chemotaxis protein